MHDTATKIENLTFGCELEYESITKQEAAEAVRKVVGGRIGTENGHTGFRYYVIADDGRKWVCEYDGSLSNGCETVTPILKGWKDIETLQEVVRELRHAGAKARSTCGLHVHVGASDMNAKQLQNLAKLWWVNEKVAIALCGTQACRLQHYTAVTSERFINEVKRMHNPTMEKLANAYYAGYYDRERHYCNARYRTLNFHNIWQGGKHTVEFRLFEATTHAGEVKANILLALSMVNFVKEHSEAKCKTQFGVNQKEATRFFRKLGWTTPEFKNAKKALRNRLVEG